MEDYDINIRLSIDLLDNSLEFMQVATNILSEFEHNIFKSTLPPYKIKSALINSTIGVEVLLKAKIASLDWREIFSNPNTARENAILTGEFSSIKLSDCLTRIEKISNISFSIVQKEKLDKIRQIRNKIVHYHYKYNTDDFISIIIFNLDFYIEFYKKYIYKEFFEEKDRTIEIDLNLYNVKEYVSKRLESIEERIKREKLVQPLTYFFSECSKCFQDAAVILNEQTVICLYCNFKIDIVKFAQFRSRDDTPPIHCPMCGFKSFITNYKHKTNALQKECVICGHYVGEPTKWLISFKEDDVCFGSIKENFKDDIDFRIKSIRNLIKSDIERI